MKQAYIKAGGAALVAATVVAAPSGSSITRPPVQQENWRPRSQHGPSKSVLALEVARTVDDAARMMQESLDRRLAAIRSDDGAAPAGELWVDGTWQPPLDDDVVYSKAAFTVIEDPPMPFDPQDILWDV